MGKYFFNIAQNVGCLKVQLANSYIIFVVLESVLFIAIPNFHDLWCKLYNIICTDGSLQRINIGEIDLTNKLDLKLTLHDGFTEDDLWGGE